MKEGMEEVAKELAPLVSRSEGTEIADFPTDGEGETQPSPPVAAEEGTQSKTDDEPREMSSGPAQQKVAERYETPSDWQGRREKNREAERAAKESRDADAWPHSALAELVVEQRRGLAFLVSREHALTSSHAVEGQQSVTLRFHGWTGDREVPANVKIRASELGFALLALERAAEVEPFEINPDAMEGQECKAYLEIEPFPGVQDPFPLEVSGQIKPIQLAGRPILDLSFETPREFAAELSGSPILVDGRIAGIWAADGAVPAAAFWTDSRVRPHLSPRTEPSPPRGWVAVAGPLLQGDLHRDVKELSNRVGRLIANRGIGLVTGWFAGIDLETRRAFTFENIRHNRENSLASVDDEGRTYGALFADNYKLPNDRWSQRTIDRADALIIFDDDGDTNQLVNLAREKRKPVFALPAASGAYERLVASWSENPIPGIAREEYERLNALSTEEQLALVGRFLDALDHLSFRFPQSLPTLDNDAAGGEDCLDFTAQAETFAKVIVSKDLIPPLAVGLFGDWGSGKSYFMGLIEEATKRHAGQPNSWSSVCTIKFNAWHYMDADLWAGLAGRIFEGIADKLRLLDHQDFESTRKKLRERLRSTNEAKREAEEGSRAAVDRLAEVRAELARLQSDRDQKFNSLSALFDEKLWKKLGWKVDHKAAKQAATQLGLGQSADEIESLLNKPEEVRALADELQSTFGQARAMVKSVTDQPMVWIIGAVTIFGPIVLDKLLGSIDLSGLTTVVAQVRAC